MEKEKIFDLEIVNIDENEIDKIESLNNSDIINIKNPSEKLIYQLNKKNFFYRPLKIRWTMKAPEDEESYLASLKRNRRKRILGAFRKCEKENISIYKEEILTKKTFEEWLDIYQAHLNEKEKGIIKIGKDWIKGKQDIAAGIFAKKGSKLIGGIILKKNYEQNTLIISYSAFDRNFAKIGINDCLNVRAILLASKLGFKLITRGKDTNLYGHHLAIGLFLFKKSLGFVIEPLKKYGDVLTEINNFDKFEDQIFFVSYNKKGLEGNLIIKNEKISLDEFESEFLEKLNIFLIKDNQLIKLR